MSASPDDAVDFDKVRRNAKEQGIPLSEIAIFYEGLTDREIITMEEHCLIASKNGSIIVAKFEQDGTVLFPEKATGVHTLAS